jgi:hypothetical protein
MNQHCRGRNRRNCKVRSEDPHLEKCNLLTPTLAMGGISCRLRKRRSIIDDVISTEADAKKTATKSLENNNSIENSRCRLEDG